MKIVRCDVEGCTEEYEPPHDHFDAPPIGWRVVMEPTAVEVPEEGLPPELRGTYEGFHTLEQYHVCPKHPVELTWKPRVIRSPVHSRIGGLRTRH